MRFLQARVPDVQRQTGSNKGLGMMTHPGGLSAFFLKRLSIRSVTM